MGNCMFAYPDFTQPTTYAGTTNTPAFSSGSWLAAMPLTNLRQSIELILKARSSDDANASTKFDIDLGVSRAVRVISLIHHNLSLDAQIRIKVSTVSDFSSTVHDSTQIDVWPSIYIAGTNVEGRPDLVSGEISAEDIEGHPKNYVYIIPSAAVTGRYVRVEMFDTTNPDGYVELSRCWVSSVWQPDVNMEYGNNTMWEDDTLTTRSYGGVDYYDERSKRRVATFTLAAVPDTTANLLLKEMQRKLGISGQLFFIEDPDSTDLMRNSFLATMRKLNPLNTPYYANVSQAFELQEVI